MAQIIEKTNIKAYMKKKIDFNSYIIARICNNI